LPQDIKNLVKDEQFIQKLKTTVDLLSAELKKEIYEKLPKRKVLSHWWKPLPSWYMN
jgi:hypothetical protein